MSELERYSIELTQVGEGLKSARWYKSAKGHWVEYDQAQALLDAKQSEINALKAHVERLEVIANRFLVDVEQVTELLEASGGADNIKLLVMELNDIATEVESLSTPQQSLAEHDAKVAFNAYRNGYEDAGDHVRSKGYDYIQDGGNSTTHANDYAQRIKAGDL